MKIPNGKNPMVYLALLAMIVVGIGVSLLMAAAIVEIFK